MREQTGACLGTEGSPVLLESVKGDSEAGATSWKLHQLEGGVLLFFIIYYCFQNAIELVGEF